MSNEHKEKQKKIKSEDTEQIRDQGQFNDDKKEITSRDDLDTDQQLEAKWESVRKPLQRKYPNLKDEDVQYKKGEFGLMLGRIGSKTGLTESQLRHEILNWDDTSSRKF